MSKKKNVKRSGLSDAVVGKKSSAAKGAKTNPFEVHVNRQKFSVMNRDTKNDRGLPGVSRAKAAKRRQETLGTEMDQMHKTNRFKDNRLGGGRFKSGEDLATAKFAKEMMNRFESKSSKRKSLFNLTDNGLAGGDSGDEEPPLKQQLTHKGQTLKEIEQFQDAVSDGDEDPEDSEMLNAEFTGAAHFGGGAATGGPDSDDRRSRKDLIDDLISETKRRKAEAAKEKDQVMSMTEKLDEAWRSLIPVMGQFTRTDEERVKPDAYDRTMREMIFEARGEPTDKLKSKEELAKQEREKLERMERDRLRRMRDDTADEKPKHRSADDLDDQFYGEKLGEEEAALPVWGSNPEVGEESASEEKGDSDEEDGEDEDDDSEEEESAEEDHFSDLKSSDDEEEKDKKSLKKKKKSKPEPEKRPASETETLPFTFELPDSYEELSTLLQNRTPSDQATILERIIKCNHPGLDAANKDKLISLAAFLCQYFNDLFDCDELTEENAKRAFEVFDKFTPHMLQLAEMNSLATGNLLREVLTEKQEDLKKAKRYPNLDVLMFLRLVDRLFSTSDFKHGVVTPAFVFISQLLTRCPVESGRDIARGLFLVTIALDYTAQSKRFLPAVIVFLDGVFRCAATNKTVDLLPPVQFKNAPDLAPKAVDSKKKKSVVQVDEIRMLAKDLVATGEVSEEFKVRAINTATLLAQRFFEQTQDNLASMYYAQDLSVVVQMGLKLAAYPEKVRENIKALISTVGRLQERKLTPLKIRDQPVKQLRMLEPKFDAEQYHDRRVKNGKPTGKSLQEAMRHKVKREMKGALRDIKLDNAFLAKQRLNKQRVLDRERKEKVKRIFAEASIQQGELNAMDRQNSRKKK